MAFSDEKRLFRFMVYEEQSRSGQFQQPFLVLLEQFSSIHI